MMVVNTAIQQLKQIPGKLVIVGERGRIYAREAGIPFAAFSGIKDEERKIGVSCRAVHRLRPLCNHMSCRSVEAGEKTGGKAL